MAEGSLVSSRAGLIVNLGDSGWTRLILEGKREA